MNVCFTGHRPKDLWGYQQSQSAKYAALQQELMRQCGLLIKEGYNTFISGGAQGADQLAFWAVHSLKFEYPGGQLKNVVYAPCRNQEKKWRTTGLFSQESYREMLERANEVYYVADRDFESPRDLFARNHAMVDNSSVLIAVYGKPEPFLTAEGGTAETMRYASKQGKQIIIVNPFECTLGV